jgi:hypothetical protein
MRRLISATLAKVLIISMAMFGVGGVLATSATAATSSTQAATAPQLDLTGITNQLTFILNEVLNIGSNNLVQCILSGFTSPACGHNPV